MSWSSDLPEIPLEAKLARLAEPAVQEAPAQTTVLEGGLRVTWRRQRINMDTGNIVFSGGVRAEYGPTVIEAAELEIWNEETRGEARGQVVVTDPEGELRGQSFKFNWKEKSGSANNVSIIINRVRVRASSILITEGKWLLRDFSLTTSKSRRPDLAVSGREFELTPGKSGRIRRPKITLFGQNISVPFTLPIALDRRVEGLRLPTVGFRKGDGVGLTWFSGVILSERAFTPERRGPLGALQLTSTLSADFGIFPTSYPTYSATLVTSTLRPSADTGLIKPLSDIDERFRQSPMESVLSRGFSSEERPFRNSRYTAALGFAYNQQTNQRVVESEQVSRRAELTLEHAQRLGTGGWLNQLRIHDIRDDSAKSFRPRAVMTSGIVSGALPLGRLTLRGRADVLGTLGGGTNGFGWARGAVTLTLPVVPGVSLSGQYVTASEFGTPALLLDRLYDRNGFRARLDYKLGPTTASLLYKYNFDRRQWTDTEFSLAWVAGSYEPFIASRLDPKTFVFGVRVRFEDIAQRLSSRSVKRK
ncbi:MAG: hypothetical protein JNJ45_05855 [Chthonomonas sp.]|nr:hypothetical protein [Chthonomonas sp.]